MSLIDFTAWLDGESEFYQVAWSVLDPKVLKREVGPMAKLEGRRVLITMDRDLPDVPEGIEVINAVDFFMGLFES